MVFEWWKERAMQRVKWPCCSRRGAERYMNEATRNSRCDMRYDIQHQPINIHTIARDGRKRRRRRRQARQSLSWFAGRSRVVSAKDSVEEAYSKPCSTWPSSLARPSEGSRLYHQSRTRNTIDLYRKPQLTARHRLNPSKASRISSTPN